MNIRSLRNLCSRRLSQFAEHYKQDNYYTHGNSNPYALTTRNKMKNPGKEAYFGNLHCLPCYPGILWFLQIVILLFTFLPYLVYTYMNINLK